MSRAISKRSLLMAVLLAFFVQSTSPALAVKQLAVVQKQPVQENPGPLKVGLALGGGGTRGGAHIGVLKVFESQGVHIDYITGTSIGALVGGAYAAGVPLAEIQKMAENKSVFHAYFVIPVPLRVALEPFAMLPGVIGIHPYIGLYSGHRYNKFINKSLPPGRRNVEETIIPFCAVSTDMLTGEQYVIKKGPLANALQASAGMPILRKPLAMDGKLLNDGFLSGNLPIKQAREMGADVVICVDIDGPVKTVSAEDFRSAKLVENRTVSLLLAKLDAQSLKDADIVLYPDVSKIDFHSEKVSDIDDAIAAGEKAALEAMPEIRKTLHMSDTSLLGEKQSSAGKQ